MENLLEALADPMHDCMAIAKSIVDRASHGLEVISGFVAVSGGAG